MLTTLLLKLSLSIALISAKVVSEPRTEYAFEGEHARLKCSNVSDDEEIFYNYINNATWHRMYPDGNSVQIGKSGPVFVNLYSLIFYPSVRESDQGQYYCCAPGGTCSTTSTVSIAGNISA